MKNFFNIIIGLMLLVIFNGCDIIETDEFDSKITKEMLMDNDWYFVDQVSDQYIMLKFTDDKIEKSYYDSSNFSDRVNTIEYPVFYNGEESICLEDAYGKHKCNYKAFDNNDFIVLRCDEDNIIYFRGWDTKYLAITHSAKE